MEIITKKDNKITWRNNNFIFEGVNKIDESNAEVSMGNIINFVFDDTELNGVIYDSVDKLIDALKLGL